MAKSNSKDIVLIGAGVLSTTFGSMLKEIEPDWNIHVYERLDRPAIESSNERNNAGTGHAALCELNYTVLQPDGSIDIEKAKVINEEFEISKQFWGHLVKSGSIENPREFINPLPHISYVRGKNNVKFLKDRYEAMKAFPMFDNIEYTEDIEVMKKWIPLMMKGREDNPGIMAASKIDEGTDVNFGELTRKIKRSFSIMKIINTTRLPEALGPYSHATVVNGMVYTSGQIPLNIDGHIVSADVQAQTKQVLENLKVVLEEAGSDLNSVAKATIFIKDMNDFQKINEVYGQYFNEHKPARSCVEVARLPKDVKVEIELVSKIKEL